MASQWEQSRANPRRRSLRTPLPSLKTQEADLGPPTLKKGATFHSNFVPSENHDPLVPFPAMPRRSPTSTSALESLVAGTDRMAGILADLERGLKGESSKPTGNLQSDADDLPVPRGFLEKHVAPRLAASDETADRNTGKAGKSAGKRSRGDVVSQKSPIGRPAKFRKNHGHASDSGLGSSICDSEFIAVSDKEKVTARQLLVPGLKNTQMTQSAITKSISASGSNPLERRELPPAAYKEIVNRVLAPILGQDRLQSFHPLVQSIPNRVANKEICNLRDLEKTLLWLAPLYTSSGNSYLKFCNFTVQRLKYTAYHLNLLDQRQPNDRRYSNGYFLDLGVQIRMHAADIYKATRAVSSVPAPNNKVVDAPEVQEEAQRSMARRRKDEPPMNINKKCSGCGKIFKRPCDYAKHKKTHDRPWKCHVESCRYHTEGWPTAKELQRHVNDKHAADPPMYDCLFKDCTYKSKRLSNCKQHMEKAHNWVYVRSKNNGKGGSRRSSPESSGTVDQSPHSSSLSVSDSASASVAHPMPPMPSMSFPSAPPAPSTMTSESSPGLVNAPAEFSYSSASGPEYGNPSTFGLLQGTAGYGDQPAPGSGYDNQPAPGPDYSNAPVSGWMHTMGAYSNQHFGLEQGVQNFDNTPIPDLVQASREFARSPLASTDSSSSSGGGGQNCDTDWVGNPLEMMPVASNPAETVAMHPNSTDPVIYDTFDHETLVGLQPSAYDQSNKFANDFTLFNNSDFANPYCGNSVLDVLQDQAFSTNSFFEDEIY